MRWGAKERQITIGHTRYAEGGSCCRSQCLPLTLSTWKGNEAILGVGLLFPEGGYQACLEGISF